MRVQYYRGTGCGGGCLLAFLMLLLWPLLLLLGRRTVSFGGGMRDPFGRQPGGDAEPTGSEEGGTVIDVEATEIPAETKNLR